MRAHDELASTRLNIRWALAFSTAIHTGVLFLAPAGVSLPLGSGVIAPSPLTVSFRQSLVPDPVPDAGAGLELALSPMLGDPVLEAPADVVVVPSPASAGAWPSAVTEAAGTEGEYRRTELLTDPPVPVNVGNLNLAREIAAGQRGRVVLQVWVNENGRADGVTVIASSVSATLLANAIRAFQWAEYQPGKELHHAVKSILRVEIDLDKSEAPKGIMPLHPQPVRAPLDEKALNPNLPRNPQDSR